MARIVIKSVSITGTSRNKTHKTPIENAYFYVEREMRGGVNMRRRRTLRTLSALALASVFFLSASSLAAINPRGSIRVEAAQHGGTAWQKISSYTTYYSTEDRGRSKNIAIAAALIDGVTIQPYGEFSFNQTVGRRTQEAGFQQAKIIVNGEYVLGTGGGVCQVSTTLYNAALKSGLSVTEFHPHSLQVGYVAPSRDAMVSTHSDLKFCNPHAFPVKLSATAENGAVRIGFWGQKDGYRYEITSEILSETPPPAPIVKEGDKEEILRSPKNGVKSEAYLERYHGDKLVSRTRLRVDEYRPVQGILVKKIGNSGN